MSLILPYFILPLIVLVLIINVYLRLKIIKKYKILRDKNIQIGPKDLMNKAKREAYIADKKPEYAEELNAFASSLNILVKIVIGGFLFILAGFALVYFNHNG